MNSKLYKYLVPVMLVTSFSGCELVDPTEVTNPNLTEEAILATSNPMSPWIRGIRRQLALVSNEHVVLTEIGSDNYENAQTFYNQNLDGLTIRPVDSDINDFQYSLGRLREMADYGLNTINEVDESTTPEQIAELHFLKAYSFLLSGEYFSFLPVDPGGEPVEWPALLDSAIENFTLAEGSSDALIDAAATLGKARANYKLGNQAEAVQAAEAAIVKDPDLIYYVEFDQTQTPVNTAQTAMYDRGNFDDLQVLPRLDFLDPKYYNRGPSEASPVALFKIEEAHLIISEAQVADSDLVGAGNTLKALVELVESRETSSFDNDQQDRTEREPGSRPDSTDIAVAASPEDPLVEGLVLYRKGENINVPTISGTSVDKERIDASLGSIEEALELIYLMRQEIFIGEGRRLSDMGVRLVISEVEYLANENIDEDHPGTKPVIPPFIDAIKDELDAFDYDQNAKTCIITHNINKILSQNSSSDLVLPFH
ncbi:MAG: hypothetical protein WDZ72_12055 [Cyclobacteriaceae bacterium]